MFILYALAIGIAAGLLLRGRLEGLASLEFRWAPVLLAALLVQIILFSGPVSERIGPAGPPLYVLSTGIALGAILRNWRTRGIPLVALGAGSNLLAIVANGGFMPVSAAALGDHANAAAGYSNSRLLTQPALAPLTDIFAMPAGMPFANVFSVGDVLIGLGVVVVIVAAMRAPVAPTVAAPEAESA